MQVTLTGPATAATRQSQAVSAGRRAFLFVCVVSVWLCDGDGAMQSIIKASKEVHRLCCVLAMASILWAKATKSEACQLEDARRKGQGGQCSREEDVSVTLAKDTDTGCLSMSKPDFRVFDI